MVVPDKLAFHILQGVMRSKIDQRNIMDDNEFNRALDDVQHLLRGS